MKKGFEIGLEELKMGNYKLLTVGEKLLALTKDPANIQTNYPHKGNTIAEDIR